MTQPLAADRSAQSAGINSAIMCPVRPEPTAKIDGSVGINSPAMKGRDL